MLRKLLMILLALQAFMPVPTWALPDYASIEPADVDGGFTLTDDVTYTGFIPGTSATESKWRGICERSHENFDDSLLFPGLFGGSPHLHQYSGNTLSNAASTYFSLRTTGQGTCPAKRANRSTYWWSALYTNDEETMIKIPDGHTIYYNIEVRRLPGGTDAALYTPVRIPQGLTMIGGYKPGDPDYYDTPPGVTLGPGQSFTGNDGFFGYKCESNGHGGANFEDPGLDCAAGDPIVAELHLPNCWNGVDLTSVTARSHVVYEVNNGGGKGVCPPSHPYLIATIILKWFYSHDGPSDFNNWHLACDRQDANPANWTTGGTCKHTDYREAWERLIRDAFQRGCNGLSYDGVTGLIGGDCTHPTMGEGWTGDSDGIGLGDTVSYQNVIRAPQRTLAAFDGTRMRMRFRRR